MILLSLRFLLLNGNLLSRISLVVSPDKDSETFIRSCVLDARLERELINSSPQSSKLLILYLFQFLLLGSTSTTFLRTSDRLDLHLLSGLSPLKNPSLPWTSPPSSTDHLLSHLLSPQAPTSNPHFLLPSPPLHHPRQTPLNQDHPVESRQQTRASGGSNGKPLQSGWIVLE